MCMYLFKGTAMHSFENEIKHLKNQKMKTFFYVLQRIMCNYIFSNLCL